MDAVSCRLMLWRLVCKSVWSSDQGCLKLIDIAEADLEYLFGVLIKAVDAGVGSCWAVDCKTVKIVVFVS
jgi:hypothetical protein